MLNNEEISANLADVREKIRLAAVKSGRNPEDIKLIAVSKTNPTDAIEAAAASGITVFGENKVQELNEKIDYFENKGCSYEWHLIGHLQTNKCKYIVGKTEMIHSVDSYKLASEINRIAEKNGVTVKILIEVNIGDEESKFGCRPENCENLIRQIALLNNIRICGLMCIAPFTENPENNRSFFRQMKDLSVDIERKNIDNVNMSELSMGMTGDYCVAIEEGATMVRVGTGIFGKRHYSL